MDALEVFVITGSESDLPRMEKCREMLDEFGIACALEVASAHRNPQRVVKLVGEAEKAGAKVVIACAGMSAALLGVFASHTDLPVIGVPLYTGMPGGIDALFSIVQMPTGVPVAAVAVNGARNAAVLAARILAIEDAGVREKLREYRKRLSEGGSK